VLFASDLRLQEKCSLQEGVRKTSGRIQRGKNRIVFSTPVTKKEIRNAEKSLRISFPDAYVAFLNAHGSFYCTRIDERGKEVGNRFYELLSPNVVVRETIGWKKELASDEDIEQEVVDNFVVFYHEGSCNVSVFCPARKLAGELAVYIIDHEERPLKWDPPTHTFETFIEGVLCDLRDNLCFPY